MYLPAMLCPEYDTLYLYDTLCPEKLNDLSEKIRSAFIIEQFQASISGLFFYQLLLYFLLAKYLCICLY